jgi:hypothetical protein
MRKVIGCWISSAFVLPALVVGVAADRPGPAARVPKPASSAAVADDAKEADAAPPSLEVVSRFAFPSTGTLGDVRWASKDSVYLADMHNGVDEVRLTKGLPRIRQVAPPARTLRLPMIRRVAVSDRWIVVGYYGKIAWKRLDDSTWSERLALGAFRDFDVEGDKLVILGVPPGRKYWNEKWKQGYIVWESDLSSTLEDWKPLYASQEAVRLAELHGGLAGSDLTPGSIRFLKRGGYIVHPSFIPGVLQLSGSGAIRRQWAPEELWGKQNTRSSDLDAAQLGDVDSQLDNIHKVLAGGDTIEVVLALRQGPGVIVREPNGKAARYRLAVLGPEIRWYDIPGLRVSAIAQIRGDVDAQGRIVLAGAARARQESVRVSESEVIVLRLPD